jgi:hypothetical protein
MPPIADLGTPDTGVSTILIVLALLTGWVAFTRLRKRGFSGLPKGAAIALAVVAATSLVLAFVLPPIIRPDPATLRPGTTARLEYVSPTSGQVFHGDPATIPVDLRLTGGRLVPFTTTNLAANPNAGHIHILVDGRLVSMTVGLKTTVQVVPGTHLLVAEFVAVDHGPFRPPVTASVGFDVLP